MNLHTADLNRRLSDFLSRRQPPKSFAANETAKVDQVNAYLRIVRKYAPEGDLLHDWWGRFIDALSESSETWAWPSEKEVWAAAKDASKRDKGGSETAWQPDSVAINLRRLQEGKPIAEDWLWGRNALRLVAAGADRGVMRDRRRGLALAMSDLYGPDEARKRLLVLKARHDSAEAVAADYAAGRVGRHDLPKAPVKRAFDADELERLIA